MGRRCGSSFAVLLLWLVACASSQLAVDDADKQAPPNGEVSTPLPQTEARARIGRVVLREPRGRRAAEEIAQAFLSAVARESKTTLDALISDDAEVARAGTGAAEPMLRMWEARFRRFEYTNELASPLAGASVQVLDAEDLGQLSETRVHLQPADSQWVAVVRFGRATREVGIGPRVELLIEEDGAGRHRIVHAFEHQQSQ